MKHKLPPRPSAVFLRGTLRLILFFTAEERRDKKAQRTAKKGWIKMKNDETQITSAALCGFPLWLSAFNSFFYRRGTQRKYAQRTAKKNRIK